MQGPKGIPGVTRFPNQYPTPTVPSDVYTQDQARDQNIFDMMTEVVPTERTLNHLRCGLSVRTILAGS